MTNADEEAFPVSFDEQTAYKSGMSKREYFAIMCMQGILSDCDTLREIKSKDRRFQITNFSEVVAKNAIEFADALLKQLDK